MNAPVHAYVSGHQPATRFAVELAGRRRIFRYKPQHRFRCDRCLRVRAAKNLTTQVYYDAQYFWCREKCQRPRSRR